MDGENQDQYEQPSIPWASNIGPKQYANVEVPL